jgi:DICT domain-containing protein
MRSIKLSLGATVLEVEVGTSDEGEAYVALRNEGIEDAVLFDVADWPLVRAAIDRAALAARAEAEARRAA